LSYDKFIWVHADASEDVELMTELGRRGMWIEIDCLARMKDFTYHAGLLKSLIESGISGKLLLSQDAGIFNVDMDNNKDTIFPYDRIFKEFIPFCRDKGIENGIFDIILIENTRRAL
jgi:predicted metal-dependent phosphotriesterase family hydrolase